MGSVIEQFRFSKKDYVGRLVISQKPLSDGNSFSVNMLIAIELVDIIPSRRTINLEKCFVKVLESLPEKPVIKDIDVLFNPSYKVDVMKMLTSAYRQKEFSLVWPGSYADGKLFYSEEGYSDYKVFEIKDYDIIYVI